MPSTTSKSSFNGFQVHQLSDGAVVIVADKWHATALSRAWNTSAAETETESLSYDANLYKKISSEMNNIQQLPPADEMSSEQTSELEARGPATITRR